jgi:hydroxymethylglutaryl-CoA lyase
MTDTRPPDGPARDRVTLREVGLRDGLQMVSNWPGTPAKVDWIRREYAAGIRHFELGSFLPVARYPMFADIGALIGCVAELAGAHGTGLAPNKRGAMTGLASGIDEIHCVISASEAHNQANLNRSQAQTTQEIGEVIALAAGLANPPRIGVGIAMSFGCSISGPVDPGAVLDLAAQFYDMGADMVSLADTVGHAGPRQVAQLARDMRHLAGARRFGIHLHDTRGLGMANATAALEQGVDLLDASLGGLGGCPAAPNATGNIVMEDLVFLCQTMGFETGVDLEKLIAVREILARELPDEPLYGALARAGLPQATQMQETTLKT